MADAIINGDFDEQTGEWLGEGYGFPRTREPGQYNTMKTVVSDGKGGYRDPDWDKDKYAKGTKAIRKELAILIKNTIKAYPEESENKLVNECRQAINKKYGKGWREQYVF